MSAQLQVTGEAKIRDIQGPVVADNGVINALDGTASQYVRGDGTLADFPTSSGGGSSVSYYLNSSVSQGTIGGVAYRELSKDPIIGAGTDIAISSNGYVANYITDANDPDVTIVPGGNFNCEFYFSVNNNTGNPFTYAELYKYDGTTFTLLGSSVGVPEYINQGTIIAPYYFAIPVPTSTLALTDRLAIRIYVNVAGRTVTLHTENSHLCQVVTTLSKGMVSLNNLTDQSQFLTTGTSGTNFSIASSGDTHTFNLPVASATNTGKLSYTDWSTFNNKQNALTNPITGLGASGNVAYFDSASSITSENSFNYDASTNRLGVNTTVPNATIGANAALDSGYSLLLKNDNANYNSIGFATDSTYGNMIQADRVGAAPSRNLTLYNYAGFISLTESGNLGVGLLTPSTGVDIYNSTNAQLWLHNNTSGLGATHGVRLALFTSGNGNLRNFDGGLSMSSEGDFQVITLGAENIRVNSANGFVGIGNPTTLTSLLTVNGAITQSSVLSSLLKTNASGTLVAAVAGTDYVVPSALTGYVPTSRTITINGTTQNLSADISYSVGTITGGGADGRVAYYSGTSGITSDSGFIYESGANRLGVNTVSPNATIGANSPTDSNYSLLLKNSDTNYSGIGFATSSVYGNTIETVRIGTAPSRNLTLYNYAGFISLTEAGNLGVGILTPNTGIDIYHSTISSLWLHTASSGTSGTDGVRLFLNGSNNNAVLRNNEGSLSMSSEGDFYIITIGAENLRVNSANGYVGIGNPSTVLAPLHVYNAENAASLLLQTDGSTSYSEIAVRNASSVSTSYFRQYSTSTTGTDFGLSRSNLATFFSNFASNFAIGTMNGGDLILGTANTERLRVTSTGKIGIGTSTNIDSTLTIYSATEANQFKVTGAAPAVVYADVLTTPNYVAYSGLATAVNNFVNGSVVGDFVIANQKNFSILFATGSSTSIKMKLTSAGDLGIGATIPDTKLDVRGEISLSYSADNGLRFWNQDRSNWSSISNTIASPSSTANLVFRTSAGVALTIEPNRNATFTTNISAQQGTFSSSVTANGIMSLGDDGTYGSTYKTLGLTGNTNGTHRIFAGTADDMYIAAATARGITFWTNGSTSVKMNILPNGNVGIGTSSPVAPLEIFKASVPYLRVNDGTRFLNVGVDSTSVFFNTASFYRFLVADGTSEAMRITSGGNVGIGTSSPNRALEILSTSTQLRLSYDATTYSEIRSDSSGGLLVSAGNSYIINYTNGTERMRITSGGNVGIGTSSPVNTLTIQNTGENSIEWHRSNAMQGMIGIPSASNQIITGSALNDFCFRATTKMLFATGGDTERMRITSSGSVCINSSSPLDASAKLNVSGNVYLGATASGAGNSTLKYNTSTGLVSFDTSARIFKKDIIDLEYGLESVLKMQPKKYKWKSNDNEDLGFIADEMYQIIPEVVYLADNKINKTELQDGEPMGINYDRLVPILVKSIQELQAKIVTLESKIN